ncbi:MAG: alpha/beta hydrolase [Oscillospiraceae bacterium]|nr:alpha/beta hydrolase [Oscillospiraceae bacterium]
MQWSIRTLLNPVITRLLIYGVNPIDLEYVLKEVEKAPLINGKALEKEWVKQWSQKSSHFTALASEAENKNNAVTARELYKLASQCDYACYMINSEDISSKRITYKKFEHSYSSYVSNLENEVVLTKIPFGDNKYLPSYIHYPDTNKYTAPFPTAILFAGLGSSKEELNTLAQPLVDRGIAVLAADLPGTGSALFDYNLKCTSQPLEHAFDCLVSEVISNERLDDSKMCTYGLCMGGGYAYRIAARDKRIKCCVNLFPLFIGEIGLNKLPRWMNKGEWANYQSGKYETQETYYYDMAVLEEGSVSCDYLLVHGTHDNWMPCEKSKQLYDKATGFKEIIVVEQPPVFSTSEAITHTMPVGEQLHWLKHVVSDWIKERLENKGD